MNGRVYSAELGKMMSPDPVTQAPSMGRNYNRYTYALNNPLKYTDPTGYTAEDGGGITCPRGGNGSPNCPYPDISGAAVVDPNGFAGQQLRDLFSANAWGQIGNALNGAVDNTIVGEESTR